MGCSKPLSLSSCHGRIHYVFLLYLYWCHFSSFMVSAGYMALMDAESEGAGTQPHTLCVTYQPKFSKIPSSADEASLLPLVDLSSKLGCSPSDFDRTSQNISGTAVAVSRGECTFAKKADLAQSLNATSVLIVDYKNSTSLPIPVGNQSKDYDDINITVASVAWGDYQDLIALPAPVGVKIYAIKSSHFDPNMIIILFGSTLITVIGALWAAHSERNKYTSGSSGHGRSQNSDVEQNGSSSSRRGNSSTNQSLEITPTLVLFWVVFLIAILLLLYFFYDYAVFFFIGTFCIAGSHGLYSCLVPLWSKLFTFPHHIPQRCMLCIKEKVRITSLLLFILCLSVGIFWAVQRHQSYAWVFQDILGVSFCISLLQTLRLPSLKIITLIMVLLFCYDVFFVFITPLFTKDGESIMVDVATGGKGHHSEMVPLVFIIPLLNYHPASVCTGRPFSILGFGDVILPGLLVVYTAVFDVHIKSKMIYLITSSLGYLVGMSGCLVALVFMESGQPALFYLVPCTLIPIYILAFKRGDLRAMWSGKMVTIDKKKRDNGDEGSLNDDNPYHSDNDNAEDSSNEEVFDEGLDDDEAHSPLMN